MKNPSFLALTVTLAFSLSAVAQVSSTTTTTTHVRHAPRAKTRTTVVQPDGIVFYNGHPYFVRAGRASLIDAGAIPNGQMLTFDGRLIATPEAVTTVIAGVRPAYPLPSQSGIPQPLERGDVPANSIEVPKVPINASAATAAKANANTTGAVIVPPQTSAIPRGTTGASGGTTGGETEK